VYRQSEADYPTEFHFRPATLRNRSPDLLCR
jgi:hypothetical protein